MTRLVRIDTSHLVARQNPSRRARVLPLMLLVLVMCTLVLIALSHVAVVHRASLAQPMVAFPQTVAQAGSGVITPVQGAPGGHYRYHRQARPQPPPVHRPSKQVVVVAATPTGRPFRLEPLLTRNVTPVERNAAIFRNYINELRVRDVLLHAIYLRGNVRGKPRELGGDSVDDLPIADRTNAVLHVRGGKSNRTFLSLDEEEFGESNRTRDSGAVTSPGDFSRCYESGVGSPPMPYCPEVPPFLAGQLFATNHTHNEATSLPEQSRDNASTASVCPGGRWHPPNCTSRHRVAIVIPFRDRRQHLSVLLAHLHPILQRQHLNYRIYVAEQGSFICVPSSALVYLAEQHRQRLVREQSFSHALHERDEGLHSEIGHVKKVLQLGNRTFNKGILMNAAFTLAMRDRAYHCFVFHDVDLIPEDDRNMYSCPEQPRHMSVAVDEFQYKLPYRMLVGGVFSIRAEHFLKVNGYSNMYWGWGGEDDDMSARIVKSGLQIVRPQTDIARYRMIKHQKRKPLVWKVRGKLLNTADRRMRFDGLNTVKYALVSRSEPSLYTNLLIDVGSCPFTDDLS